MTGTPLSKKEIERNMRDVAHAVAQQALEGLYVSAATVEGHETRGARRNLL